MDGTYLITQRTEFDIMVRCEEPKPRGGAGKWSWEHSSTAESSKLVVNKIYVIDMNLCQVTQVHMIYLYFAGMGYTHSMPSEMHIYRSLYIVDDRVNGMLKWLSKSNLQDKSIIVLMQKRPYFSDYSALCLPGTLLVHFNKTNCYRQRHGSTQPAS